jgi:methylated-DNA-[protein]-cysteine S-methyltransferase
MEEPVVTAPELYYLEIASPLGRLRLVADGTNLCRIEFEDRHGTDGQPGDLPVLAESAHQLGQYFEGRRRAFDLPLAPRGTEFQQRVWQALLEIPYGEVCSYRDIAERLGNARAVRAVGTANGRNPLPIIVPCHRVIGSDGSLTGYAGGLEAKRRLLALEGVTLGPARVNAQGESA